MRQNSRCTALRTKNRALARVACAVYAAIALFSLPERALAEPELTLSWPNTDASHGCPDLDWAMTRIAAELGHAPTADVREGVHAIVALQKSASGFALRLQTARGDAHGERQIEGTSCRELSEAAILIIALSVTEASEERTRQASTSVQSTPNASAASGWSRRERGSDHRATQLGLAVRAEWIVELGLLGLRPTQGPGLALAIEWRPYRIELSGTWLALGKLQKAGQEIEVQLGSVRVSGCALFGTGVVRGGPCIGVELGGVRSRNTDSGLENDTLWAASSLTGRLALALGARLSLVIDADLVASWGQLRFFRVVEGADGMPRRERFDASKPLQLRAHLGLELGF